MGLFGRKKKEAPSNFRGINVVGRNGSRRNHSGVTLCPEYDWMGTTCVDVRWHDGVEESVPVDFIAYRS